MSDNKSSSSGRIPMRANAAALKALPTSERPPPPKSQMVSTPKAEAVPVTTSKK
jgi:hypothetical protein